MNGMILKLIFTSTSYLTVPSLSKWIRHYNVALLSANSKIKKTLTQENAYTAFHN